MEHISRYVAKEPDQHGFIDYGSEEDKVWQTLYNRQIEVVQNRACPEFFDGLMRLDLKADKVPQCAEVSKSLKAHTGWSVTPVQALISFEEFFGLLADKIFPAASFIRRMEDLDYLPEPDVFHEIFGHCPMLTHPAFAAFSHKVGHFGKDLSAEDQPLLARLYWFTVEFGLMQTTQGLRIYGAGILSSKEESQYSLESPMPERRPFDLFNVLRTPYRYDEIQKIYYVINSFDELYDMVNKNLVSVFAEARALGDLPPIATDHRSC